MSNDQEPEPLHLEQQEWSETEKRYTDLKCPVCEAQRKAFRVDL